MSFSVIDIIFVCLIGLFMIRCYLKGFVSEIFSMAGVVFGVLAALFFYKNAGELIRIKFMPDQKIVPEIIAFAGLLIIVIIIIKLLEKTLVKIIDDISLTNADSVIGIFFGLAEGIALVSLILFLIKIQPFYDASGLLAESFFARLLLPLITGKESAVNV